MVTIHREDLIKAIDDMNDDEIAEFQALLLVAKHKRTHPGSAWFRAAYEAFAPVREAIAATGMSELEIDDIIDEELEAVRQELYEERMKAIAVKDSSSSHETA